MEPRAPRPAGAECGTMEIIKSDKQLLSFKPPGLGIIYYAVMDNQYRFWSLEVRFCGNKNLMCRRSFTSGQWVAAGFGDTSSESLERNEENV